jgi:hypothetical protein
VLDVADSLLGFLDAGRDIQQILAGTVYLQYMTTVLGTSRLSQ